ncbi:MAG: hypothetical protein IJA34_17745 [Lachnospiraceae bacterium]|nr:hypothetical protein [Lachnospiraceae bacterium]
MQLKILEVQDNERYIRCAPSDEFRIFDVFVDKEEMDMFEIFIAKEQDLKKIKPVFDMYMDWLNSCEKELTEYLQEQLGEELPIHWMKDIEVYSVSIVFNSIDDYGATISFGVEGIFGEHIVEINFEKNEIEDNGLVG